MTNICFYFTTVWLTFDFTYDGSLDEKVQTLFGTFIAADYDIVLNYTETASTVNAYITCDEICEGSACEPDCDPVLIQLFNASNSTSFWSDARSLGISIYEYEEAAAEAAVAAITSPLDDDFFELVDKNSSTILWIVLGVIAGLAFILLLGWPFLKQYMKTVDKKSSQGQLATTISGKYRDPLDYIQKKPRHVIEDERKRDAEEHGEEYLESQPSLTMMTPSQNFGTPGSQNQMSPQFFGTSGSLQQQMMQMQQQQNFMMMQQQQLTNNQLAQAQFDQQNLQP